MKLLVTGAGGLLGRHFCELLAARHAVVGLRHDQLDITDVEQIARTFESIEPEVVINCATASVDRCEREPELSAALNLHGPTRLAQACARSRAQLVHFSSNYVFSGETLRRDPYTVDDIPNPLNQYGRSKLAGERAVREQLSTAHVVRTSWVYGPLHQNFLGSMHRRLRWGEPVRTIADAWASTTYAPDLVQAVEQLVIRRAFGLHHVVSAGVCSRFEFALEAARQVGLSLAQGEGLIEIVSEANAGQLAARPRWSPLASSSTAATASIEMRHWRDALRAQIAADC